MPTVKKSVSTKVTCSFPSDKIANEFIDWLCGQGEQDWWTWCDMRYVDSTAINYDKPNKEIEFKSN